MAGEAWRVLARRNLARRGRLGKLKRRKTMSIKEELAIIEKQNGGILRPIDVVTFAQDPRTELHSKFEWDDSRAAFEYRLWQAREIIRVEVTVISNYSEPIRAYISMKDDRKQEAGGYRPIMKVLSNKNLRDKMLQEAYEELEAFQQKYKILEELYEIFEAIKAAKTRKKVCA